MEEPNAHCFGSTGSAKGWLLGTLRGLLVLIFIRKSNSKKCKIKFNQGIPEYVCLCWQSGLSKAFQLLPMINQLLQPEDGFQKRFHTF